MDRGQGTTAVEAIWSCFSIAALTRTTGSSPSSAAKTCVEVGSEMFGLNLEMARKLEFRANVLATLANEPAVPL